MFSFIILQSFAASCVCISISSIRSIVDLIFRLRIVAKGKADEKKKKRNKSNRDALARQVRETGKIFVAKRTK